MSTLTNAPMITSAANPSVKAAARLATRKGRRDAGAFLVEGPQAVSEGLGQVTEVFATPQAMDDHIGLLEDVAQAGAQIRMVTPEVLRELADTVTPQGVVAVAPIRPSTVAEVLPQARFVVILDGVSDPGNGGAIIRTADAAGADAVVFLQGSADPYNPKAVRASTGSVFHLPVITGVAAEDLTLFEGADLQLLGADANASVPLDSVDLSAPTALIFGGEATGLSQAAIDACRARVHVPIARSRRPGYDGHAESLNLAAAVAVMAYSVHQAQHADARQAAPGRGLK